MCRQVAGLSDFTDMGIRAGFLKKNAYIGHLAVGEPAVSVVIEEAPLKHLASGQLDLFSFWSKVLASLLSNISVQLFCLPSRILCWIKT